VYGSIYTAEHDIDRWISEDRIDYRAGSTVFLVRETAQEVEVCLTRHGQVESLTADRVLLAAGAVNSTRVLLNSAPVHLDTATIRRTGYAVQIFGSTEALEVQWPSVNTQTSHFVALKDEGISPYWAHVQVGQPNELVLQRLGLTQANLRSLRGRFVKAAAGHLVSVALNAHSNCGPTYEVRVQRNNAGLPKMETSQRWSDTSRRAVAMYGGLLARSLRRGGFYRVPFAKQDSGSALTYHFGASFPMSRQPRAPHDTDVLGRPFGWQRVHVVDTSVLPAIPATTVGVVTLGNAHRIATAAFAN
jgi:choline dehydrogenase-like flavoprotein